MLRVGIVGMGFMGTTHAAGWAQTPAKITGMVSPLVTVAARYGATIYPDLAAMLPYVDVVDICTPTNLHHPMVLEAAAAGKHIVCEKPLALTNQHTAEMIAACDKAGVQLLVAQVVRFFPEYAAAKGIVERGEIGRVGVVRLTRCSFKPARNNPASWFHDLAQSGGMMFDLMVHDFDYARWISGDVDSVFAKNIANQFSHVPGDYALVIVKHKNGALTHIEGGWAYPAPLFRTALEIAGDQGLIEHPAGSSAPLGIYFHETSSGANADIAVPSSPLAEDPYVTQIKHFYELLTDKTTTPRVTAADGAAAVQIALAAVESAETGRRVRLEEVR
ncbi:MAG: Gfo/Idh/MocA family oxidoreductase [Anaerolineae bacterium]|nr:Gfo/Idh/MocA family oxidoreductase [Anaerolineae bacterium]